MANMDFGARKEGTKDYIPLATMKQINRMEQEGVGFGDTIVYLENFNQIMNFLREEDKKNAGIITDFLNKEKKTLVFKYGTEQDMVADADVFTSKNYRWSVEDCNNGWYIVISKI